MSDHERAEQMTDDELEREFMLSIREELIHLLNSLPALGDYEATIVLNRVLDEWDELERVFGGDELERVFGTVEDAR